MPKFDVELIHQESGAKKTLLIEAVDTDDARQTAERMGYSVASLSPSQPAQCRRKARHERAADDDEEGGVDLAAGCRACGVAMTLFGALLIGWFALSSVSHNADQSAQRFVGVLIGVMLIVLGIGSFIAARVVARRRGIRD